MQPDEREPRMPERPEEEPSAEELAELEQQAVELPEREALSVADGPWVLPVSIAGTAGLLGAGPVQPPA